MWSTIQIEDDLRNGISGAVPVPPDEAGKEEVINSLVANVESMIKADRKITSLKKLQVPSLQFTFFAYFPILLYFNRSNSLY